MAGPSDAFRASVAGNNAARDYKAGVMAREAMPAVPQVDATGGVKMGAMSATLPSGETITRQVQQYADAPETLAARREATAGAPAAREAAVGGYHAQAAADRRQQADLADPAGAVQRAQADQYQAQGYYAAERGRAVAPTAAAAVKVDEARASDITQQTPAKVAKLESEGYYAQERGRAVAPVAQATVAEKQAGAQLAGARAAAVPGEAAATIKQREAAAGYSAARTRTEEALRQPRVENVQADTTRDLAAADPRPNTYPAQRRQIQDRMSLVRTQMGALPAGADQSTDPNIRERWGQLQGQLEDLTRELVNLSGQQVQPAATGAYQPLPQQAGAAAAAPMGYGPQTPAAPPPAPSPAAPAPATQPAMRPLPAASARQYLFQANGDKDLAKRLAAADGFDPMQIVN